jgi:hypothetical protein
LCSVCTYKSCYSFAFSLIFLVIDDDIVSFLIY